MSIFKLGEVKLPTDDDYDYVRRICENNDDWTLSFSKSNLKIYVKKNELSSFQMLKAKADFDDITATQLYNVMHDGEYRYEWDDKMAECIEICYLSPVSDIGYYCLKSPKPFKNRDFVTQRSWLDLGEGKDKIIFNRSVNHAKYPPKKNIVRGVSFLTAVLIKPTGPKSCQLFYVTQSDPGGSFPSWIVNVVTTKMAPKLVKKIHKASQKYDKWKAKHNPQYKPWENPELIKCPRIDWNDIISLDLAAFKSNEIDESNLKETDIEKNDEDADD